MTLVVLQGLFWKDTTLNSETTEIVKQNLTEEQGDKLHIISAHFEIINDNNSCRFLFIY